MNATATDEPISRLVQTDTSVLIAAYLDAVADEPLLSRVYAKALRERARHSLVSDEFIPVLIVCLTDSPDQVTFTHLAKCLAVFGRAANDAETVLLDWLQTWHVSDDDRFWNYDGVLHAAAFLGGEKVARLVDELLAEVPPRVMQGRDYRGKLTAKSRRTVHTATLQRMKLILDDEGARWVGARLPAA